MDIITSRKNPNIQHLRRLASDRAYRRSTGEFLCDGSKLLEEALQNFAEITGIYTRENKKCVVPDDIRHICLSDDVFDYASPLENSPGPLFTVHIPHWECTAVPRSVLVLENVQDPGNIGTVLRSAAAMGVQWIILVGGCADPYNPKCVRGAMGALFRQKWMETDAQGLAGLLRQWDLPLRGAALLPDSRDVRSGPLFPGAVAVGNEGKGLTQELLKICDEKIIIPMTPGSESFNAAVAASVLMWEMMRENL